MSDTPAAPDALHDALRQVLAPLARLALARGVTHATLQDLLRLALVQAADAEHAALPANRRVSRIATATGLHRREVTRLVDLLRAGGARDDLAPRSHASELFHHWRTDPVYCDRKGSPAELPRSGPEPSFETLARCTTRDVHPRSLMDELVRLGLAAHDTQHDTVRLLREAYVPQGDQAGVLKVLGNNVGAHFEAAVDNVLFDNRRHHEQAIFASGLSDASLAEFRTLVRDQWQRLLDDMVPALKTLVARDEADAEADAESTGSGTTAPARHRVRIGLYTHARPDDPPADVPTAATKP